MRQINILGNGYIEGGELDGFLKEYITTVNTDGSVKSTVGTLFLVFEETNWQYPLKNSNIK